MNHIHLHNTLSRTKDLFTPIDPGNIRMYVCGPTVYDLAHLGNARSAVAFDQMRRTLGSVYPKVTFVRNVTDIDDKIIARAAESGEPISALTLRTHRAYLDDTAALGVQPPDVEPRATDHIPHMLGMIGELVAKGFAYAAGGHVLFSVRANPRAGILSGHGMDALLSGASERVEEADYKRDQADFVLWKPSADGQPGWDSPWGFGRPGWHIECSAMAAEYLGDVFDIHGGGHDLIFPHHENEIAQSTCAHGTDRMANVFAHNGMLLVDGKKMSKSAGNFLTVRGLLDDFPGRGEAIRLVLMSAHYRQPLDFSRARVTEAVHAMDRFYGILRRTGEETDNGEEAVPETVAAALYDDINTPLALTRLHELAAEATRETSRTGRIKASARLLAAGRLLGLFGMSPETWFGSDRDDADVERLMKARLDARKAKDFKTGDDIRAELGGMGVTVEDGPGGTIWRRTGISQKGG